MPPVLPALGAFVLYGAAALLALALARRWIVPIRARTALLLAAAPMPGRSGGMCANGTA